MAKPHVAKAIELALAEESITRVWIIKSYAKIVNADIADVFDVDSNSRKRAPFGRIFYTKGKSLIFYAFDLDHQSGMKDAVFQVWGEKDLPEGRKAQPVNLGILYLDSQESRRWALRCDDPKQLAQIDAVFVTVEPVAGRQKPSSKAFLYALLRKEANHPG